MTKWLVAKTVNVLDGKREYQIQKFYQLLIV